MKRWTALIWILLAAMVVFGGCTSRVSPPEEQELPEPVQEQSSEPEEEPASSEPEEPEEEEEEEELDTEEVEAAVDGFLLAVQSGSSEAIRGHIDYRNMLQLEDGQSDANFLELGKRLQYTILSAEIHGGGATVSVQLVNVDMKKVRPEYVTKAMELEYNNGLEDEPLPPDAMEAEYERLFAQTLTDNAANTVEQTVDIALIRDGTRWRVQSSDALRNGIFGDFWKATQTMG